MAPGKQLIVPLSDNVSGARPRQLSVLSAWVLWNVLPGAIAVLMYLMLPVNGQPANGGENAAHPVSVSVAFARTGPMDVYLTGLGTVIPLVTVSVKSRVEGQLTKVDFKEGQMVRAGQVLAEIDTRPFELMLEQAQGQVIKDEALLANARIDLERYRTLFKQDSIAKQQVDTQESLVRQYEGTVKIDMAAVGNARLQLTYCRITAPVSGRLGLRQIDPGNIIHATDANGLVTITQLQPITVVFTIPEDNLPPVFRRLRAGERMQVTAYDHMETKKLATGFLVTADNQIDANTAMVKLKAEFPNQDFSLFPNQFVNVRLLADTVKGATLVPAAAIQRGAQGTFVYVVKSDRTTIVRPVSIGPANRDEVSVLKGLASGERVVTDGASRLSAGAAVQFSNDASKQPVAGPKP